LKEEDQFKSINKNIICFIFFILFQEQQFREASLFLKKFKNKLKEKQTFRKEK